MLIDKPPKMRIHAKGGDLTTDIGEHHAKGMDLTRSGGLTTMAHDAKTCTISGCSHCSHPELFRSQAPVVIEHVHDTQVHERHIPKILPVETHKEVHKHVTPVERVEVHKHVHPHERVEVVEHVHPRERIDIHEHVRPIITTEVHEHYHPEITREVHKDIYPPEIKKVAHRDVDLGEVERKVIEKDLGKIDLGKEVATTTITDTHHHHSGEHDKHHHSGEHDKHHHSGEHDKHHHGGEHVTEHKEKITIVKEHHSDPKVTVKHSVGQESVRPHDLGETERKMMDKDLGTRKVTETTHVVATEKHHGSGDHVVGGHHVDVVGNRPGDFEYKKEGVSGSSNEKGVKDDKGDKDKEKEKEKMEHLKKKDDTRSELS